MRGVPRTVKSSAFVSDELTATFSRHAPGSCLAHLSSIVFVLTAGSSIRDLDPEVVAGSIRKPFDVEVLIDMVTACVTVLTPRPQPPDCPPAESAEARAKPS